MGIKTLHLEIYGNVHEATIASLNEKAVRKIRTGLNKDFNMETDNELLNSIVKNADILITDGFCGYDFNFVATAYNMIDGKAESRAIDDIKTYDIKTLINAGKAKYKVVIAEKAMDIGGLYLIACTKMNSQKWTSEIVLQKNDFDPKKILINVTDFDNQQTQLPSFIIDGMKYDKNDINFKRDNVNEKLTINYDIIRFNGGRGKNRYEQIKLEDVLNKNFEIVKECKKKGDDLDFDSFKLFTKKRTLIL